MIFITSLKKVLLFISQITCILRRKNHIVDFFIIIEILNMIFFMLLELQ